MDILRVIESHAKNQPDKTALGYIGGDGGLVEELTYKNLWGKVSSTAFELNRSFSAGSRVVILLPTESSFIVSFLAALHAGLIPVPCPVGYSESGANRILKIIKDCEASGVITNEKSHKMQFQRKTEASIKLREEPLQWLFTEEIVKENTHIDFEGRKAVGRTAYLQYTSGSTSSPKGVMISHDNLIANLKAINNWFGRTAQDISITWLPHYHDMGLVDGLFSPLYTGGTGFVMAPMLFITKPLLYLQTISDYKIGFTGGPGFGLDHCVLRISDEQLSGLNLSSLKVLYVGAELLRLSGLLAFEEKMRKFGLNENSLVPAYGLAEATLAVSLDYPGRPFNSQKELISPPRDVVACGPPVEATEVLIVDPETKVVAEAGGSGEIWVCGPVVAEGYWQNSAATKETFEAFTASGEGPYLRTGDLGFMSEGQVFITGRHKELIIIHGVNYYPQDIEEIVALSHEDIPLNATAAFSVETLKGEALMIVSELKRKEQTDEEIENIRAAIAQNIGAAFGLIPHEIKFIQTGKLPKTSSGKIQRLITRDMFV